MAFVDRGEDGDELAGFVQQGGQLGRGNATAFDQEFQPVFGFCDLFEAVAGFGDEFGFGAGAGGFAVVGADGGAGTEDLSAEDLGHGVVFRQLGVQLDDPQGEGLGARFQVLRLIAHGGKG